MVLDVRRLLGAWPYVAGALLSVAGCSKSETEPVRFASSDCKSKHASTTALLRSEAADAGAEALGGGPAYDGLFCFAWKTQAEGGVRIDVYNFEGPCGRGFEGRAVRKGSDVDLFVRPKGCAVAACGSCQYDVAFDLLDVPTDAPLNVSLALEYCEEAAPQRAAGSLTLPLDTRPDGIICQAGACRSQLKQTCGIAHCPPCSDAVGGVADSCATAAPSACGPGLVCEDDAERPTCVASCSADSDCMLEIEHCQDGSCRLRETFSRE